MMLEPEKLQKEARLARRRERYRAQRRQESQHTHTVYKQRLLQLAQARPTMPAFTSIIIMSNCPPMPILDKSANEDRLTSELVHTTKLP